MFPVLNYQLSAILHHLVETLVDHLAFYVMNLPKEKESHGPFTHLTKCHCIASSGEEGVSSPLVVKHPRNLTDDEGLSDSGMTVIEIRRAHNSLIYSH